MQTDASAHRTGMGNQIMVRDNHWPYDGRRSRVTPQGTVVCQLLLDATPQAREAAHTDRSLQSISNISGEGLTARKPAKRLAWAGLINVLLFHAPKSSYSSKFLEYTSIKGERAIAAVGGQPPSRSLRPHKP